jgi:hypothetical protein
MRIVFSVFSILFLIYLILPGPSSINDFPDVPNGEKSQLEGDTIQVPNVKAFFSNNYRSFVTKYYQEAYQKNTLFPFPPLRLNYPPEFAFTAIKDQTQSTYLEEYVYPLRDSLYVNGLEPFDEVTKKGRFKGATNLYEDGNKSYETKVTLRYYPSPIWARIAVWLGVNISIIATWIIGKKVFKYG